MKDKNLDDPEITENRKEIVKKKKLLRNIYKKWYGLLLGDGKGDGHDGAIFEIGSGAGFIKEKYPYIFSSEILLVTGVDVVCNGLFFPLKDGVVKKIVMVDVFHHIKDSLQFLKEAERCLMQGGSIVMIEPFNTFMGKIIWKNFHHENFLPEISDWKIKEGGPLSGANQALPWIVFCRDRDKFKKFFPSLSIEEISTHTSFSYLLSGGLSYPQLVPDIFIKLVLFLDDFLCNFCFQAGMFATIRVKKNR